MEISGICLKEVNFNNKLYSFYSSKAPIYDLQGHEDKVMAVDWSNPEYIVSGGADNSVRVFKSKKIN